MANMNPVSRKGKPNKPKPGAAVVKEATAEQWRKYVESGQFEEDMLSLPPADRLRTMTALARFIAPTLKSVEAEISGDGAASEIVARLAALTGDG